MRIWEDGYVINQIVIRAPREITNAMIAAHLGDERNDQRAQTKANTAKMMRSHPRCSRTRQTASGGLGVATAGRNLETKRDCILDAVRLRMILFFRREGGSFLCVAKA